MILIKAVLAGLIGISLCMANISGIVTDTGGTPISGAIVRLEKGGQTVITGTEGKFTLVTNTTNIPINAKLLPKGLSARISGNMLNLTIAQRSTVEVGAFDLTGKSVWIVRQALDAGTHFIALPRNGAGVYLYKVKAGNNEFVLRGNGVSEKTSGSPVTTQGSSLDSPGKQAMAAVTINNVIAVTKTGYLNYRVVVYNIDTSGIRIKMIVCADTLRDIDGNVYQAVRIGTQVWMAENLRVTKYTDGSPIPLDTTSATWDLSTTPKYCFYNNTTDSSSIRKYGSLYNWYVIGMTNPKKVAPAGWHMPSDAEWSILENFLISNGYNWDGTITGEKISKSMAAKTDWLLYKTVVGSIGNDLTKNNSSGFSALPGGIRSTHGLFSGQSGNGSMISSGLWWSGTEVITGSLARSRSLDAYDVDLGRANYSESWGFSVRLVRD